MVNNYIKLFENLIQNKDNFKKDKNLIKNISLKNQYKILNKYFFI